MSRNICEYNYQFKVPNSPGKRRAHLNRGENPLTNQQNICQQYNDRVAYKFWWGNLKEREHLEDLGLKGRMIRKCAFKNEVEDMCYIDPAQEHVMGCCECGNEPLGFIKCEEFLDKLWKC